MGEKKRKKKRRTENGVIVCCASQTVELGTVHVVETTQTTMICKSAKTLAYRRLLNVENTSDQERHPPSERSIAPSKAASISCSRNRKRTPSLAERQRGQRRITAAEARIVRRNESLLTPAGNFKGTSEHLPTPPRRKWHSLLLCVCHTPKRKNGFARKGKLPEREIPHPPLLQQSGRKTVRPSCPYR